MSDRFKFRVWKGKENRMVQDVTYLNPFLLDPRIDKENEHNIPMQCTGMKDKNDKLIFEGDIVNQIYEDGTIHKCEVINKNCSFHLKFVEDENHITTPLYCYAINYLGHYTEKKLEVIGNIYENKELLDGNKD